MRVRIVPVLVAACAISPSVSAFQGQMFDPPVISPVGDNPLALDSGDMNGDGLLDLVRADRGTPDVHVYFGDGAGGLSPATSYDGASDTRDLLLGDIDLDGDLDVVTIGAAAGELFLFFNDGSGVLSTTGSFPIPSGAQHLAMADLDHDGDLDVCVTVSWTHRIIVMINDGSANFTLSSSHALPLPGADVELADLDGDGELDLIVTGNNQDQGDTIYVFLGDGTGGFGPRAGYFAGADCTAGLAAAD
ncbi:MAG: VCBS repeat-containing protein, partial [Planctomycetota bacterium]